MDLRYAHLADFASVDANGKLTIVGAFDIVWDAIGVRPISFPPFYIAASFEASVIEGADHQIEIQLMNEDEEPCSGLLKGTLQLRAHGVGLPAVGHALVGFGTHAVSVPELGDYHFRFRVDGVDIGTARVSVLAPPGRP